MFQLILKAYQEVAVMYALGQKRTCAAQKVMSAKCQKRTLHACFEMKEAANRSPSGTTRSCRRHARK